MRRAVFLRSVQTDLLGIMVYIAETGGRVDDAVSFVTALRDQCHKLAGFQTTMGRSRPELHAMIRSFPYKGYVILFRYNDNRFEVVNIVHASRDMGRFFGEDDTGGDSS